MNKITEYFNNIPDEEVKEAIKEIKRSDKTGIIESKGLIRKHTEHITTLVNSTYSSEQHSTIISLLKQGAYRWVK